MLAGQTGYPVGFAVTAVVIVVAFAGTRTRSTRTIARAVCPPQPVRWAPDRQGGNVRSPTADK
jgi:hypothetical protein